MEIQTWNSILLADGEQRFTVLKRQNSQHSYLLYNIKYDIVWTLWIFLFAPQRRMERWFISTNSANHIFLRSGERPVSAPPCLVNVLFLGLHGGKIQIGMCRWKTEVQKEVGLVRNGFGELKLSYSLFMQFASRWRSFNPLLCWDCSASALGWGDIGQFQPGELCCCISPVSCLSNRPVCGVMVTILVSLSRGSLFLLVLCCWALGLRVGVQEPFCRLTPEHFVWWSRKDVVVLTWDLISVRSSDKNLNPKANLPN